MRRAAEGGVWGAITAPQHTKAEGVRGRAPSERRPACKQAGKQGEALRRLRRDVYRLTPEFVGVLAGCLGAQIEAANKFIE